MSVNNYYEGSTNEGSTNEESRNESLPSSPPSISNNIQIVGKGTYGFILKPALANRALNGTVEEYPNDVTKVYFNKNSLNSAIKAGTKIYSLTGNEGHKLIPYREPYMATNIPASVISKLKSNEFGKVNIVKKYNGKPIPIAHMKNLGINMTNKSLLEHVESLRKIPTVQLLEQVLKVMNQVKIFIDNGFIHGDIRPPNMMINPETGIITIIDFDLFEEIQDFMKNNVAFYNRPPENYIHDFFRDPYSIVSFDKTDQADYIRAFQQSTSYVVKNIPPPYHNTLISYVKSVKDLTRFTTTPYISKIMPYLRDLLSRNEDTFKKCIKLHDSNKIEYIKDIYTLNHYIYFNNDHKYFVDKLSREKLLDILYANTKYFTDNYIIGAGLTIEDITEEQIKTKWNEMIVPYFDGFGLAVSLLELLTVAKYEDAHISNLRDNVLMKMAAWKVEDRIDIFKAIELTEAILAEAIPPAKVAAVSNNAVAAAVEAAKAVLAAKAAVPSPYRAAAEAAKAALAKSKSVVRTNGGKRRRTTQRTTQRKRKTRGQCTRRRC